MSTPEPLIFSVDELWLDGQARRAVLEADASGIRLADDGATPEGHLAGTVLPGLRDVHVHLGLIDPTEFLAGGIAAVADFGWIPEQARAWLDDPNLPEVRIVGAFLTCRGGYPSDREWAPPGSVREVTVTDAAAAVDEQLAHGATGVKVMLNSTAGPVFDDATLRAIVTRAHSRGAKVVAHTEGAGQAARAFTADVDALAHAPFTERLDDSLLRAMAHTLTWVSTLDIHGYGERTEDFERALDNVRRFHAYGGVIRYGTDLGNGPLPVGINTRELAALVEAKLSTVALINAVAAPELGRRISHTFEPRCEGARSQSSRGHVAPGGMAQWLASTSVLDHHQIREKLQ
ncbi:MAG: amidohydrolase [Cryobacterium sp.]|nr:amidohydrolase [Cryobacterium sp.]